MAFTLTQPYEYQSPLPKCNIRIGDSWYDCTAWRHSHPGGAELLDKFHLQDATDAFFSLHSAEAVTKLRKMRTSPISSNDRPREGTSLAFDALRRKLETDGWFDRNWAIDFGRNILPVIFMLILGTYLSYTHPWVAVMLLSLGMQQAGWVCHDYIHGRGPLCNIIGIALSPVSIGFSRGWWSHKHNTHHTFPNRKECDSDVHNEPVLHLWFPTKENDVWFRKYQHCYYLLAYSLLYVSWRMQSIQFALGSRNWVERSLIAVSYVWLACLPWKVAIGSLLISGFCVAIVVTANHQTEELLETDDKYNFVVDQFRTTRGIITRDPITEYFFGGMQYQLEHHLFPMMPRYRYPALRPLIKRFAEEQGLQYHLSGVFEILKLNFDVMKANAVTKKA
jgi:fatty acid desaturase